MRRYNYRGDLEAALERLRRIDPMGYAQLLLSPFGIIPAHAQEDCSNDWWYSQEAAERLEMIEEGLYAR